MTVNWGIMKSEFEEKSYEAAFNMELISNARPKGSQFFAPGQVIESDLGFDAAWMIGAKHPFWKMVARVSRQGIDVSNQTRRKFPSKIYNLFIQYKRSEYIGRSNGSHYTHFNGPYYRFKFDDPAKQLKTLKELERHVGSSAHVLYAAPEFHTITQLVDAADTNTVISKSVMTRPKDLKNNHTSFNFKKGHQFLQNPEFETAEGIQGDTFLSQLTSSDDGLRGVPDALEAVNETLLSIREWRTTWERFEPSIEPQWLEHSTDAARKLALNYLAITSFSAVSGVSWVLCDGVPRP